LGPDSPEVLARLEEGLPLVDIIARQLRRQLGSFVRFDELVSQGREGLLAAARSFEPDRGVPFRRWANLRIRGHMIDGVRQGGNIPRRVYRTLRALQAADTVYENAAEENAAAPPANAETADATLSDTLGTAAMAMALAFLSLRHGDALDLARDEKETPEEEVSRAELIGRIRAAIAERPEAERQLIERHYFGDVSIDEAAREIGLSKSWASRLHARAIEAIQKSLRRDGIDD
jgi:RNA polymerase sigma factor for flagellar operon FliA